METYIQLASTIVITVATVVLAWLTYKYVRFTKHIVDEMRTSKEPFVYVDFELPEQMLRLAIGNGGQTPARNITFTVEEDIPWLKMGDDAVGVAQLSIIKSGLSYLPAGRTMKWYAGIYRPPQDCNEMTVRMTISYENEEGLKFERKTAIDMSQYSNVLFETFRDPTQKVADVIKDSAMRSDRREREKIRTDWMKN